MKIQIVLTALLAVLIAVALAACSADMEEEEEEILLPEPAPEKPVPDWIDGKLTIEVGNYKTGAEMLNELQRQRIRLGIQVDGGLLDPRFPISGKQYTIEVEVVTMFEVGLNEPTSYKDTYRRYLERGYCPLTPEEAIALRLQFKDQPNMSSGERMAKFQVLMDPSVIASYRHHNNGYYFMGCARGSRGLSTTSPNIILNPATGVASRLDPRGTMPDTRFAVIKK